MAVAIVEDGRVVLARGHGVRRLGDPTPVDAETRFGIASSWRRTGPSSRRSWRRRPRSAIRRRGRTPALVGELEHWQHDTFLARWRDRELRADAYVTFALEPDGSIAQVRMVPASSAVDFSLPLASGLLSTLPL